MKHGLAVGLLITSAILLSTGDPSPARSDPKAGSKAPSPNIYVLGHLKPVDSTVKVKAGRPAPDFTLPSVSGKRITLSQYRGKMNVVLSFVPAAFSATRPTRSSASTQGDVPRNIFLLTVRPPLV